jgi:hypothetical protein
LTPVPVKAVMATIGYGCRFIAGTGLGFVPKSVGRCWMGRSVFCSTTTARAIPRPLRRIRDELREVMPGLYLGPALWQQHKRSPGVAVMVCVGRAQNRYVSRRNRISESKGLRITESSESASGRLGRGQNAAALVANQLLIFRGKSRHHSHLHGISFIAPPNARQAPSGRAECALQRAAWSGCDRWARCALSVAASAAGALCATPALQG